MDTSTQSTPRMVYAAFAAVCLIWGSTYWVMRVAIAGIAPFLMSSIRFLSAGLVLLTLSRLQGTPWPSLRQWLWATPVGVLMFLVSNGTVAYAEKEISSGVAAVICGTMPLWSAALSGFFGQKTSAREWLGLWLGFGGVAALASKGALSAEPLPALLLLLAPVSWALGSHLARKVPLAKGAMSVATQMLSGGAALLVVSGLLREQWSTEVVPKSWLALAYLSVFGSVIGFSAFSYLLTHTRPAVATSYAYVNPAIAVAIGVSVGGESAGPELLLAVALIMAATVLVMVKPRQRRPLRHAA
jgi:drug/metabolite transporter (DMT)-like permease